MSLADRFKALDGYRYVDEDGESFELTLDPPLSDSEIRQLASELPCPIPQDVLEMLHVTRGIRGGGLEYLGIGPGGGWGLDDIFPHALEIAQDGWGNFWVIDLLPESRTFGPIYYACHDPAVIVYQCATLDDFLDGFVELLQPSNSGMIDFVHEQASINIWSNEPNAVERDAALAGLDPELRTFAESLGEGWKLVDLRNAKTGDGFAWGRAKQYRRYGTLPIFGYVKRQGLLQRLLKR